MEGNFQPMRCRPSVSWMITGKRPGKIMRNRNARGFHCGTTPAMRVTVTDRLVKGIHGRRGRMPLADGGHLDSLLPLWHVNLIVVPAFSPFWRILNNSLGASIALVLRPEPVWCGVGVLFALAPYATPHLSATTHTKAPVTPLTHQHRRT